VCLFSTVIKPRRHWSDRMMDRLDFNPAPAGVPAAGRPMGAILVDAGRLDSGSVDRILDSQRGQDQRFGAAGIKLGLLNDADVDLALSRQYGYPCLRHGESKLDARVVSAFAPGGAQAAAVGALRNQIMLRWFDGAPERRALAVVSAERHEGRSYLAANLAVAFSQLGRNTLLIDADMRHPEQHVLLGCENHIGLSAVLSGRAAAAAVLQPIPGLPGLTLLCAGAEPPNPLELLARPRFPQLLAELSRTFEVILLDSPSAADCADAETIALRAGAALIVARKNLTRMQRLRAATDVIYTTKAVVIGGVLNEF